MYTYYWPKNEAELIASLQNLLQVAWQKDLLNHQSCNLSYMPVIDLVFCLAYFLTYAYNLIYTVYKWLELH